ncbi:hypothetical protein MMC18_007635 [Xylographa bjoerkii]|nr:hypothetical protein [Xylographa bjoerkii]
MANLTACPCQPSFNAKPAPTNLEDDAKAIRSALDQLIVEDGKDVIVVIHSYGGVVGTQATDASLGEKARQDRGRSGRVLHLLYLCAFILPLGDSLGSALGGGLPPFIKVEEDGTCNMLESARRFYNDLPKPQQNRWVAELRPHPAIAQLTPISYAAYMHPPVTYLYCEKDEALPLEVQKMMVAGSGPRFETETCTSGHSPFLSMPETVLKVVEKIAAS